MLIFNERNLLHCLLVALSTSTRSAVVDSSTLRGRGLGEPVFEAEQGLPLSDATNYLNSLIDEACADFTMLDRLDETAPAYVFGLFFVIFSVITFSGFAAAAMLTESSLIRITFCRASMLWQMPSIC